MTAPLLNLPIMSPLAGPSSAPTAQGAAGGFEALLSGLFGGAGDQIANGPLSDKEMSDEDAALQSGLADGATTPPQSAQAQVLAAMLATAAPQNLQTTAEAATSDWSEGEPASASAPPLAAQFLPPAPAGLAGPGAPPSPLSHKAGAVQTAPAPHADLAQPEPQIPVTPAATDPQVAIPAADQAPKTNVSVEPSPATGTSTAPVARPAADTSTVTTPSAGPAPQAPSQPAAPVAPPVGAQSAPQVMAQTAALSAETPVETAPVQPNAAPRNAKSAEAARRGSTQGAATPIVPTDDATSPTAIAPNANASASGGAAPSIETETAAAPRDAKTQVAADTPDFQPPAPVAAAHTTPAAHAAPVAATSATVANLTAQISKKLEGQSTKFDVELNPAGLGRVSVSVEIAASGKMTAAMSFDSPQAAAELRARSHELQRALEQAGFDLSGGLSFDVAGDRSGGRSAPEQQQNDDATWRGRAFQAVLAAGETVEAASSLALNYGRRSTTGVDVRI